MRARMAAYIIVKAFYLAALPFVAFAPDWLVERIGPLPILLTAAAVLALDLYAKDGGPPFWLQSGRV